MAKTVLIIGDLHFPYHHKGCLDFIFKRIKETDPDVIVQIGDLYDFYSMSKFPRDHSVTTPEIEVLEARTCAEKLWSYINKLSPSSNKYQILGNHCVRPLKRVEELAPSLKPFVQDSLRAMFKFEAVDTIFNPREELIVDGNVYIHGNRSKIGDHMREFQRNVIHGHTHRGGVLAQRMFRSNQKANHILWELDVGYAGDPESKALSYTPTRAATWTLGLGEVDSNGPRFIPYRKI